LKKENSDYVLIRINGLLIGTKNTNITKRHTRYQLIKRSIKWPPGHNLTKRVIRWTFKAQIQRKEDPKVSANKKQWWPCFFLQFYGELL